MSGHYRVKVPGKLLIAGDYAILEPGNAGIVVAVDRYMTLDVQGAKFFNLSIEALSMEAISWTWQGGKVSWLGGQTQETLNQLAYVKNALEVVHGYLAHDGERLNSYSISIKSDLMDEITGLKYGLGSSGAVVVGIICGVMAFYSKGALAIDQEDVFKLALIAHHRTQGNGSGVDIAASVYGGWLHYVSVDKEWFRVELARNQPIKGLVNKAWPRLKMVALRAPASLELLVGWSGQAVATGPMIKKYQEICSKDFDFYHRLQEEIETIMAGLLASFDAGDGEKVLSWIDKQRQWLQTLDHKGKIGIETPELKRMCDIAASYGAAKTSGAGGGDCGIGLVTSKVGKDQLVAEWVKVGVKRIDINVCSGFAVTRLF